MSETVCIPRARYEYLVECERLVDMEFEEKFSEKFIKEVKESEKDYESGKYKRFKTFNEAKSYLDSL